MMLPLKAILSRNPRKDGLSAIYFQYCYSSTNRVLLNTEIYVPASCWNKKRQTVSKALPIEIGDYEAINQKLVSQQKSIELLVERGMQAAPADMGEYVRNAFAANLDPARLADSSIKVASKKQPEFFSEIASYIKSQEKKVVEKGLANFRTMRNRLLAFQEFRKKPITFQSLDYTFYTDLVDFLTYKYVLRRKKTVQHGLKTSSIGITIKYLRMFVKDRVRRKVITPVDMDDFKIVDEESDAIYLAYDEIAAINAIDLSEDPTLALHRDMFVLGCCTGLRFSDYSTLAFSDYRNGMLYKKTAKKDTWVIIPLRKEAAKIFIDRFKQGTPYVAQPVFNKYIKEIAKRAGLNELITFSYKKGNKDVAVTKPKHHWVTSHTCRRSFCTNEYLSGTDISLIMKISGHKTHKNFFRYIKVTALQAAQQIQKVWELREGLALAESA